MPKILQDAQDIAVVAHPQKDRYIFAAKPSIDFQREAYNQSVADKNERQVPAFQAHWQFDEKSGITGSSTYLALRFDQKVLRPQGLSLPGLLEAKTLESQGKLENGVYRDYGIVVYSNAGPNKQVAANLFNSNRQLPLIVPFQALSYEVAGDNVNLSFADSPKGIIQGKEAQDQIARLNYKADSGVHGLGRYYYGNWGACWYGLRDSGAGGRVDWICGEAAREILMDAHSALTERKYKSKIRALQKAQKEQQNAFEESLNR